MKVIKIEVSVSTNRVGSKCSDEIEVYVEETVTEEEIEEAMKEASRDWAFENIDWNYQRIN